MNIIISGGSEFQKNVLDDIGFNVETIECEADTNIENEDITPEMYLQEIAHAKGRWAAERLLTDAHKRNKIVIATETKGIYNGRIMKEPATKSERAAFLKRMSGKTYRVVTGLCVWTFWKGVTIMDETEVTLKTLSEQEIKYYSEMEDLGLLTEKFAAGVGQALIESISGNYHNLFGLPVNKIYEAFFDEYWMRFFADKRLWKK